MFTHPLEVENPFINAVTGDEFFIFSPNHARQLEPTLKERPFVFRNRLSVQYLPVGSERFSDADRIIQKVVLDELEMGVLFNFPLEIGPLDFFIDSLWSVFFWRP